MNENIKIIREQISKLERELSKEIHENSGYFIIKRSFGTWNHWDDYFTRVGFHMEADVKKAVEAMGEEMDCLEVTYFEVDKNTYLLYNKWLATKQAMNVLGSLVHLGMSTGLIDSIFQELEEIEKDVRETLGHKHCFQHITPDSDIDILDWI